MTGESGPVGKLSFDETKIFILRDIKGVVHKVTIDEKGNEVVTPLKSEQAKEK